MHEPTPHKSGEGRAMSIRGFYGTAWGFVIHKRTNEYRETDTLPSLYIYQPVHDPYARETR